MSTTRTIYVTLEGALLSVPKSYLHIGKKGDLIIVPLSVVNNLYNFSGVKRVFASDICEYLRQFLPLEEFQQENGTYIRIMNPDDVITHYAPFDPFLSEDKQKILLLCKKLSETTYKGCQVVLLSQNPMLLIAAAKIGVTAQSVSDRIFPRPQDRYKGLCEINVSDEFLKNFSENGEIKSPKEFHENEFVSLKSNLYGGGKLARYSHGYLQPLRYQFNTNFKPLNLEQIFLSESLYAPPDIAPLVIASGAAGTGKTYATVSAAMNQLANNKAYQVKYAANYEKIIISTPAITDAGESLGYLPGDIFQKLKPYFGGIFDSLVKIQKWKTIKDNGKNYDSAKTEKDADTMLMSYIELGLIEIQSIGFLAGHNFDNSFVILDEAQNVDPNFFINIVTRIGEGSKLVVLGDPFQVKSPNLSRDINGIIYMMELWKDEPLAWQIRLNDKKSIRSPICQRAIDIMS